jgi:adenylate cyclase, class 2
MPIEFEAKILDIDPVQTARKIINLGGRQIGETVLLRRFVYDIVPGDMSRWIRLRDTGSGSTLTVKEIHHDGIDGTEETEVSVGHFEVANELLSKLGFRSRSYQENRRTSFLLNAARLEIDEWPHIPPYLEIEADSREEVLTTGALLGYAETDLWGENTVSVYARYGIDLMTRGKVSFDLH